MPLLSEGTRLWQCVSIKVGRAKPPLMALIAWPWPSPFSPPKSKSLEYLAKLWIWPFRHRETELALRASLDRHKTGGMERRHRHGHRIVDDCQRLTAKLLFIHRLRRSPSAAGSKHFLLQIQNTTCRSSTAFRQDALGEFKNSRYSVAARRTRRWHGLCGRCGIGQGRPIKHGDHSRGACHRVAASSSGPLGRGGTHLPPHP